MPCLGLVQESYWQLYQSKRALREMVRALLLGEGCTLFDEPPDISDAELAAILDAAGPTQSHATYHTHHTAPSPALPPVPTHPWRAAAPSGPEPGTTEIFLILEGPAPFATLFGALPPLAPPWVPVQTSTTVCGRWGRARSCAGCWLRRGAGTRIEW